MKILVIGGTGLVGSNLIQYNSETDHKIVGTFHTETSEKPEISHSLDKTDDTAVSRVITEVNPDAIIDTAAFHNVDLCENERKKAWDVNAQGSRNVADAANTVNAHYVFISTDYVFDGTPSEAPFREDDPVNPINYYSRTKYAGEQAARIASKWAVLRTSVVYGISKPNFVTWAVSELQDGKEIDIVDDQTSTPTYARDLAKACVDVVEESVTGVFHATGPESLSRYEFTQRLAKTYGYDRSLINPISTEEFGQEAPRPEDGSLDSTQLYEKLGWEFTAPETAFERMQIQENL